MLYVLLAPGATMSMSHNQQQHVQRQRVLMTVTVLSASYQILHVSTQMVHEDDELYSVTEMASLLFGNEEPPSCYASHRLLSQERIFFKQAGRSPPRFQARSAKEVHSLKAKRIADEKVMLNLHAVKAHRPHNV